MNQNRSKIIDEGLKDGIKHKLILKKLVNYISQGNGSYLGCKKHVFYFGNGKSPGKETSQIFAQQSFSLNRQMRIIKIWKVNFKNVTFMNQSDQLIGYAQTEASIWKINNSYNLSFVNTIFTYDNDFAPNPFLQHTIPILSQNDNVILTSDKAMIIFIFIKKDNGIWINYTIFQNFIQLQIAYVVYKIKYSIFMIYIVQKVAQVDLKKAATFVNFTINCIAQSVFNKLYLF